MSIHVGYLLRGECLKKLLRLCPIPQKKVACDGVCKSVSAESMSKICPVQEKALDLALNG